MRKRGEGERGRGGCVRVLPVVSFLLPLAFLLLFYFYPLGAIFRLSFAPQGEPGGSGLRALLEDGYYVRLVWFTLGQAALSTLLTLLLALPGAYVFARYDFPGKSLLSALATVPFVLPTVVVAAAFSALLGPAGLANAGLMDLFSLDAPPVRLQHTLALILIAHVFYNYTLVLRIVGNFWANLDPQLTAAARVLGASRWRAFREVTLPLLVPSLGAAGLLVFIFTFTSFGVVLILGGPRFATLEVEIYRQTVQRFNLPLAAALSLLQIAWTLALMVIYTRLQAGLARPLELRPRQVTQQQPQGAVARLAVVGTVALIVVLLVAPLVALVARSLGSEQYGGLGYYVALTQNPRGSAFYVPPARAIGNSLRYALAAMALSTLLGGVAAWALARPRGGPVVRRLQALIDPLFILPLGTSAVTLGLGYVVALGRPPLNLRTSALLVVSAHTLVALPFVVRTLLPALRAVNPRLREAAAMLGAGPWQVWREVDLPIVVRALLVGAAFAFTVSLGEFGATALIARPERPTVPVAIYRFLGQPGSLNYGQALAMSTILMLVCAAALIVIERFRVGPVGEF